MNKDKIKSLHHWTHKWGGAVSEAILESSSNYFYLNEIEGFIGYRLLHGCAVVLGDPVCAPEKKTLLAEAFQKFCDENMLTSIYFIASKQFASGAINRISKIMIEVGEEVIFDPSFDPMEGHKGAKLRNTIHHANHLGLSVKEYIPMNIELEKAMLQVGKKWVNARRGPQIYLGHLNFFDDRTGKRWFYLQDGKGNMTGMALLSSLEAYHGWLLKFLITLRGAPRGASELLMVSLLDTLRQEGCHYLTYGMIPGDRLGEIIGLGKVSTCIARGGFKLAKWLFHLGERNVYWHKFHPHSEKCYVLFSSPTMRLKELRALSNALKIDF